MALVSNGDVVTIDAVKRTIDVAITAEEMAIRWEVWVARPLKAIQGTLYKYIKLVSPASAGCVTDE